EGGAPAGEEERPAGAVGSAFRPSVLAMPGEVRRGGDAQGEDDEAGEEVVLPDGRRAGREGPQEAAVDAPLRHREPGLEPRQEDAEAVPGAVAEEPAGGDVGAQGEIGRRQPAEDGRREERSVAAAEGDEARPRGAVEP